MIRLLLFILLITLSPQVVEETSLISQNDSILGIDSLTLDTATGREGLDVTLSTNRSFEDVFGQFGIDGDFEGWGYATQAEVRTLFLNHGFPDIEGSTVNNIPFYFSFVALLGETRSITDFTNPERATFGYTGTIWSMDTPKSLPGYLHHPFDISNSPKIQT